MAPVIGPTIQWLLLALVVILGFRFLALCGRAARIEREVLLLKRGVSALVFDAMTNATVTEYRDALEHLHKEFGVPWAASDRETNLADTT